MDDTFELFYGHEIWVALFMSVDSYLSRLSVGQWIEMCLTELEYEVISYSYNVILFFKWNGRKFSIEFYAKTFVDRMRQEFDIWHFTLYGRGMSIYHLVQGTDDYVRSQPNDLMQGKSALLKMEDYKDMLLAQGYHATWTETIRHKEQFYVWIAVTQFVHDSDLNKTVFTMVHETSEKVARDYYYLELNDRIYEVLQNWDLGEFIKKRLAYSLSFE